MIRKKIIIALLSIFILSACGSNVETIPTSTSIPTLQAISTFTPEPTATHTPIPTATPFQYTSCMDEGLREKIRTNMEDELGMTASEYFQELMKVPEFAENGQYAFDFQYSGAKLAGRGFISGAAEVSLAHLPGFSKGDVAMCVYVSTADEPDVMIPVVQSFTKNGEYSQTFMYKNEYNPGVENRITIHKSMEEVRDFFGESGEKVIGDVVELYIMRFGQGATDADFTKIEFSIMPLASNMAKLTEALAEDYLSRVETADGHPAEMVKKLDPNLGDVGLFADYARVIKKKK